MYIEKYGTHSDKSSLPLASKRNKPKANGAKLKRKGTISASPLHPRRQAAQIENKTRISAAPTAAAAFQSITPPGLLPPPPVPPPPATSTAISTAVAAAATTTSRTFCSELTPAPVAATFQSTSAVNLKRD